MRTLQRLLIGLIVLVIALVVAGALYINDTLRRPLPQLSGEMTLPGLDADVEIIRDAMGVPRIYADTSHDLFFAQGYVQAQDRWWQMEFFRHIGRGEVQELTGQSDALTGTDIYIRVTGWRDSAEKDLAEFDEDTLDVLQAFADGVNAYLDSRSPGQLAVEYSILGLTGVNIPVRPWEMLDSVVWTKVMANDLTGNADVETVYAALMETLGPDMVADLFVPYPYDRHPTVIGVDDLPDLDPSVARATPVPASGPAGTSQFAGGFDASRGLAFAKGEGIGSNNWVVSGDRTESGSPLLANDPHLGIQMPSIWYQIGLHCRQISAECPYNVTGFAFSPTPAVVVGFNDHIAWGVTTNPWDTQDLYMLEINPDNELQYRWNDGWRDMTVRTEVIRYGDSDETLTLPVRETHLGPIINDFQRNADGQVLGYNNEDPMAFRWTETAERGRIIQSVLKIDRASSWETFLAALEDWTGASQNFVYADTAGNIGYKAPALVPIRAAGHTGLAPVDGTTDAFEWRGYVPFAYLPELFNPERGLIVTANHAPVPEAYYEYLAEVLGPEFGEDANFVFGQQWAHGYRAARITEMIEGTDRHTPETFMGIHGDNKFLSAMELMPTVQSLDYGDAELNDARDWLAAWDFQMDKDSAQAALYGIFWTRLAHNTFQDQLGDLIDIPMAAITMEALNQMQDDPDNAWWDDISTDSVETRDDIFRRSFAEAHAEAIERMGADRSRWAWGTLHTAVFVSNPLGLSGIGIVEDLVNRNGGPTSGGGAIINATAWSGIDAYELSALPSLRMIVGMDDLTLSMGIHTTGQSGHPLSQHYADMIPIWQAMEYQPMWWTRDQVAANASATLTLKAQ
jgi:penicillin G amidase